MFCGRIERGEYEGCDYGAVAFAPLNPVTPGHMLFVPMVHVPDARRIAPLVAAMSLAASWARNIPEDFNLITSAGPAATQTVFHLHVHYVPRREGDGLKLPWTDQHV